MSINKMPPPLSINEFCLLINVSSISQEVYLLFVRKELLYLFNYI